MLADDIVQDMYLKLADCQKQINDFYVIIVMKNIFLDHIKKEKLNVSLNKFYNLESDEITFEIDDQQKKIIDDNNNHIWDTGSFAIKQQPEKVYFYEKPVNIRTNWDLEVNWAIIE